MVFIDCEFHNLVAPRLMSIGLVSTDGRELYAELANPLQWPRTSEFVKDTVALQFGRVPHQEATCAAIGRRVGDWLTALDPRSAHDPLPVAYDHHADLDLLEHALREAGMWQQWEGLLLPTHVGYLIGLPEVDAAMRDSWRSSFEVDGIERHHALADARALRWGFRDRRRWRRRYDRPALGHEPLPVAERAEAQQRHDGEWPQSGDNADQCGEALQEVRGRLTQGQHQLRQARGLPHERRRLLEPNGHKGHQRLFGQRLADALRAVQAGLRATQFALDLQDVFHRPGLLGQDVAQSVPQVGQVRDRSIGVDDLAGLVFAGAVLLMQNYVMLALRNAAYKAARAYPSLKLSDNRALLEMAIRDQMMLTFKEEGLADKIVVSQVQIRSVLPTDSIVESANALVRAQNELATKEVEVQTAMKEAQRISALNSNAKAIDYMNAQANFMIAEGVKSGKVHTIVVPFDFKGIVQTPATAK